MMTNRDKQFSKSLSQGFNMKSFKLATYNVNSIRSRLHIVIPWLKENRPDVICMQETKVADNDFPVAAFREAGYHVAFRGEKRYNGVAIASRLKPDNISSGLDSNPRDEDRFIRGVFSGITILNTYIPQGQDRQSPQFIYKLDWYRRLVDFLEKECSSDKPVIWCGDLNVSPETSDVYEPKRLLGHVCFTTEVWDAFNQVKAWGLQDIFRKHHPGKTGQYTFFDYRAPKTVERSMGWRIDHILATKILAEKSVHCTIDMNPRRMEKPSDHTIVFAEFLLS
jgi:exodeoxyribonuclease-3